MNKANLCTLTRILFAPVFMVLYLMAGKFESIQYFVGFIMLPFLALLEFTDFLDGYFARKTNTVSDFGKLFDPIADVILHMTAFFCYLTDGYISIVVCILLFYREFSMLFLRMIALKNGVAIGARKGGKFKTIFYILTSFVCLTCKCLNCLKIDISPFAYNINITIFVMSIICVVLSYLSFIDYLKKFKSIFFC